ncbi:unnamed protein product [Symbiodinium necroappetens]|uniref:WWE domain-containing protein n=1 Tax=Symbiodinium necroappetens TaxID=1628268 RepID=A0A813CF86_9DINO|nr:unnamed protein product [Symbiodinium necroappetens]
MRRVRSSNTALQKKLDDKTRMLEQEQEFNAALVDGLRQVGTRTCSEASGRYETVACWEYLEREPDSWRRYLPDAEQSLEEAHWGKLPELTIIGSGFRYLINFSARTQTNVETRKKRTICRREIPLHADATLKMTTETEHLRGENQHLNSVLRKKTEEIQELDKEVHSKARHIDDLHWSVQCLHESARKTDQQYAKLHSEHAALKNYIHESDKLQSELEQDRRRYCKILLSQLPPKPLDESARHVCRSLSVEDPKYAFLSRQLQSSIVGHRLRLGSDLWCDPARVSVTRIEELVHPESAAL